MDPKSLRVDLVDRHVNVLVVFVVVADGDVLVVGKPQSVHKLFHEVSQLLRVEASILGVK